MKTTTMLLVSLLLGSVAFSQSLGEIAKKERERREKNKEEGKTSIVVSEEDLYPEGRPSDDVEGEGEGAETASGSEAAAGSAARPRPGSVSEYADEEELDLEEEDVPDFIPPDAPLEEKLRIFQLMRRYYESQVREIDEQIAKNEARLSEIEAEIAATSAAGGAGLPVAPRAGTGVANRQMTGQESQTLVAEQNRLQTMTRQLEGRKEQLKLNLQQKGRAAGIPPGYLRF